MDAQRPIMHAPHRARHERGRHLPQLHRAVERLQPGGRLPQRSGRRDQAEQLWQTFEYFSGYGFNKSHAVSYSMLSYQCAWLLAAMFRKACSFPGISYLRAGWL